MPINDLATAAKYTGELDKVIVQESVTGFMADNTFRSKFVGAKTVIVPDMDMVGLADYNRDDGYATGGITVKQTSFELTKDRGRKLVLDREDMDETGIANLAGQVLGEFARTKVVPEMDAYVLSKLGKIAASESVAQDADGENANTKAKHTTVFNSSKPLAQFNTVADNIRSRAGFNTELVAFVHPTFYTALKNTAEFQKTVVISEFKQGEISLKVKSIDGIALIPVAADRMKSDYVFNSAEKGGFTPAEGAVDNYLIMLPKKACSLVKKTETMRIFTPEQNKDRDAYEFNYRLYYDCFVKKSDLEFIESVTSA